MTDAATTMADLIPVVVTGGILTKFTEHSFPKPARRRVRRVYRRRKARVVSSRVGNFRNVGY